MQRRWTLPAVAALLAVAGAAFALAGSRLVVLERQRLRAEARTRAADALAVVSRHVRQAAVAPTSAPAEQWMLVAPRRDGADLLPEGWGALFTAQAEHLEGAVEDLEGALALYIRVVDEAADDGWQRVAALRAGALAARLDRRDDARGFLDLATGAPTALRDPSGPAVHLVALYHLAALEPDRVTTFLEAAGEGHRLTIPAETGVDDLILALEARAESPSPRLAAAAERVRRGHEALRALPADGVAVLANGRVGHRNAAILEARSPDALLTNVAVTDAAAFAIVPTGRPRADETLAESLGPPLVGLEIRARALDPPDAAGALLGLVAGLGVYALGAVLALVAIHRSQRAARMQTDFVAAVSHELKTPIASVRAMAEFLADGRETDAGKVRDYARRIEAEMGRLGTSVRNVLDAARVERQGRMPVHLESGDPARVVEAVAEAFAPTLEARGFAFGVRTAPAGSPVALDAAALKSALMNLIDNAAKFSGQRREIDIDARPEGVTYRIDVRDRGRGIEARDRERLFRRFARADDVKSDAVPGVGLGLFVVRQIVDAHHGTVRASPREGGGSEFTVALPLADERGSGA